MISNGIKRDMKNVFVCSSALESTAKEVIFERKTNEEVLNSGVRVPLTLNWHVLDGLDNLISCAFVVPLLYLCDSIH